MLEKPSITITVKLFGGIAHTTGVAKMSMTLQADRPDVRTLLRALRNDMPHAYPAIEKGLKTGSVNVLLDGRNVRFLNGFATPLTDGAVLAFLPPVGGG